MQKSSSFRGLSHGISSRYFRQSTSERNIMASTTTSLTRSERADALMERLEELLVFEILKDGPTTYKRFSVRTLYKYVISAITCGGRTDYPKPTESSRLRMTGRSSRNVRGAPQKKSSSPTGGRGSGGHNNGSDSEESEDDDGGNDNDDLYESNATRSDSDIVRRRRKKKMHTLNAIDESESMKQEDLQKASENEVTYRERLGGFLHPRDMRKLVTPFSASNEPEIIVRRHAVLLNFDPMRAIILRDRLLVLVPDGADSILVELERRIRGGSEIDSIGGRTPSKRKLDPIDEVVQEVVHDPTIGITGGPSLLDSGKSIDSRGNVKRVVSAVMSNIPPRFWIGTGPNNNDDKVSETANSETTRVDSTVSSLNSEESDSYNSFADHEWNELEGRDWIDLPFELQSVDAVLHSVSCILADDVLELQEGANTIIGALLAPRADIGDHAQEILRNMKNSIEEMHSRVKGFVRAIDVLLEDYEDMSLMNLTRVLTHPDRFIQPVPQSVLEEESDEPELILESHLQEGNTLTNALSLIQGQVNTTEDFVERKSDSIRNRLLYIDLVISILSLSVAMGSFVGSIYGMNVPNGFEENTNTFRVIVFTTIGGCVAFVFVVMFVIRKLGALPSLFEYS